ncbi:MAG: hypothetical protein V4489_07875 [Chlamydiota bacterium]
MTQITRCSFLLQGPGVNIPIGAENFESKKSFTDAVLDVLKTQTGLLEKDAQIFPVFCELVKNSEDMPNRLSYTVADREYSVLVLGDRSEIEVSHPYNVAENLAKKVSRTRLDPFAADEKVMFSSKTVNKAADPMLTAFFNSGQLTTVSIAAEYPESRCTFATYEKE